MRFRHPSRKHEEKKELQQRKDHLIEILIIISGFIYIGFFRFNSESTTTLGFFAFMFLFYAVGTLALTIRTPINKYYNLIYAGVSMLFPLLIVSFFVFSDSLMIETEILNPFLYLMWFITFFVICMIMTLLLESAFMYPSKLRKTPSFLLLLQVLLIWGFLNVFFSSKQTMT